MAKKSALQIEIETAAAYYRAIGELGEVGKIHGTDFERTAAMASIALQAQLDREIREWNEELGDDDLPLNPQLTLCAGVESWEPWAKRDKCEVYIVVHGGPMCQSCTAQKARWEADERETQKEQSNG
jgi:hypothetical protein